MTIARAADRSTPRSRAYPGERRVSAQRVQYSPRSRAHPGDAGADPARRRWLLGACAWVACAGRTRAADDDPPAPRLRVDITRHGDVFDVQVSATVAVPRETAWEVLTDYDHAAQFVPGMTASRVVQRDGPIVIVEQIGAGGFLFASEIALTMRVTEFAPERVEMVAIAGALRRFGAQCTLAVTGDGGTRIEYHASFETDHWVPPLIGLPFMRSRTRAQFEAWLAEMERRANPKARS